MESQNEELDLLPPLSPISKSLNSSVVDLIILTVVEFETLITEAETLRFIHKVLPMTPRFTSIIENDKKGVPRWKKVELRCEDHVIVPTFPTHLQSREDFDEHLREYVAKVGCEKLSKSRPLWEVHIIKYPSLKGVSSILMKISHAVGDGYSLAKILFFAMNKASDPSASLSIPQLSIRSDGEEGMRRRYLGFLTKCMNTVSDFTWSWLKASVWKDQASAIRSGKSAESERIRPINISCLTLPLAQLKQIKSKLGATMNDVIMGIISYIIHLYMVKMGQISLLDSSMTILVMVNMRGLQGYKSLDEMLKAATWGNHSRFLPVPIPSFTDVDKLNPLDFIIRANQIMNRKKNSMSLLLVDPILNAVRRFKGQQGLDELVHMSLNNASTILTNLIGPEEQIALGKNPVSSLYFLVTGIPQSLSFTSVSCKGELKLVATMEKGFIDAKVFTSCMNEAYANIVEAAFGPSQNSN